MALLGHGSLLLAAALLVGGCEDRANTVGRMEAFLFDQPVECELAKDQCLTTEQPPAVPVPEHAAGRSFVSTSASRHAPGLYLYFEFIRPTGAVAQVEIDLPTSQGADPTQSYLKYQEHKDGIVSFSSSTASGSSLLPAHLLGAGQDCACEDGLLELVFVDHGPDKKAGTKDDQQRRLSRLRYSREQSYYCRNTRLQEVKERFQVGLLHDCPGSHYTPAPSSGGGSYYDTEAEVGCHVPEDDGYYEDEGCESSDDSYYEEDGGCGGEDDSDSDYASDGGCEGDYSDSDYSSSEGCESDSGGDYDSGGCEGDSGGDYDSGGCESDAYAAVKRPRRRGGRWRRAFGLALPMMVLGLLHGALRRRRRRPRGD
jgi:hypothetical protein